MVRGRGRGSVVVPTVALGRGRGVVPIVALESLVSVSVCVQCVAVHMRVSQCYVCLAVCRWRLSGCSGWASNA